MSADDFNNGLITGLTLKGVIYKRDLTSVYWQLVGKEVDSRWRGLRISYGYLAYNGVKWTTRNPFQNLNYSELVLNLEADRIESHTAARPTLSYSTEVS